jgi:hypothetical protein
LASVLSLSCSRILQELASGKTVASVKRKGGNDDADDDESALFEEKKRKVNTTEIADVTASETEKPSASVCDYFAMILIWSVGAHFGQKPVKRKSKKSDDVPTPEHQHIKKPRKALTAEEWLVDATVNLDPEDAFVSSLCGFLSLFLSCFRFYFLVVQPYDCFAERAS